MFDVTLDDRTRHRPFRSAAAAPIVPALTVLARQYQPASTSRLRQTSIDQQFQQQQQ